MKSPQLVTVIVAAVFAVIAYVLSSTLSSVTPVLVAAIAFVSAFIAPLIGGATSSDSSSASQTANDSVNEDVKTLYVGNLPYRANETTVRELFANYGSVLSVRLMKDKHTGKRRGFGFVEMTSKDLDAAITALNDTEFQQRTLKVREAKERPERVESANEEA
jgi:RNA recognition motif-containing protein